MFLGSAIVGVFAAIWFAMGVRAVGAGWELASVGVPISALTILATYLRVRGQPARSRMEQRRIGTVISWASLFEGVAIPLAVNGLSNIGRADLILPAVALIVGLHFLPIAYFLRWNGFYLVAAAMAGVALLPPLFTADTGLRNMATGTGAAFLLWTTCWIRLAMAQPEAAILPMAVAAPR